MTEPVLPNHAARRLFLARQALSGPVPDGAPADRLLTLIRRLGFVQIDSINTVERAHHMILRARSASYRPAHLTTLLERRRTLFEHWTHDAAAIPTEFYPYWRLRFERDRNALAARWRKHRRRGFEEQLDQVLAHVRASGPVLARELGGEEGIDGAEAGGAGDGWWDWRPSKTALEYLWRTGALAVAGRDGFQKRFDLAERVIPDAPRGAAATEEETIGWACAGALDRLGFATSGEIAAFWGKASAAEAKVWCADERAQGRLIELRVEGADGASWKAFARPDVFESADAAQTPPATLRVLSPFDPLLRDRKRTERLFGFFYRIEVFVPEARRRYGYYVFPLLEGARLIGRIDMRRNSALGALEVRALWLEPGVRLGSGRRDRLEAELRRVGRFAGCDTLTFADGWLRAGA